MQNQIAAAQRLRDAFKNGVPTSTPRRDQEVADRDSDEAREDHVLASYHTGVDSVPETGPALLKKGEAVIPAERNPMNPANKNSKAGLFDKVEKKAEKETETPHLAIRKAHGGYILSVSGDEHLESGDHCLLQDVYDALCEAYQRDPKSFKSDLWGKLISDAANADAAENPSNSNSDVVKKTPAEIDGAAGRTTNTPMPKAANTKASAV
jgi:hypothetical protein